MTKPILILFLALLFLSGCIFSKSAKPTVMPPDLPLVSGAVIDEGFFRQGGKLLLLSFKAGPGAEAGEKTDNLSVQLMKGIQEALSNQEGHWQLTTENTQDADFVLDGFIEEFRNKGKQFFFSVDGEIWSQETGAKIFTFTSASIGNARKEKPEDKAYQIGQAIGDYIVAQDKKE